jgi:hypothetical protein
VLFKTLQNGPTLFHESGGPAQWPRLWLKINCIINKTDGKSLIDFDSSLSLSTISTAQNKQIKASAGGGVWLGNGHL